MVCYKTNTQGHEYARLMTQLLTFQEYMISFVIFLCHHHSKQMIKLHLQAVETTVAAHDTTGGMETKISEAAMIAKLGIDVYIVKVVTFCNIVLYPSPFYIHFRFCVVLRC